MAFPTTGIIDNFNRANEGPPPSTDWTTMIGSHGHKVLSNECVVESDSVGGEYASGYNASTYGPDCEAYVTVIDPATWGEGVFARLTTLSMASADGYVFWRSSGDVTELHRVDDGAWKQLGADGPAFVIASGDKLGIECIGSTIKGYVKDGAAAWAEQLSRSDATYGSAGYLGIDQYPTTSEGYIGLDDFGGGTVEASSSSSSVSTSPSSSSSSSQSVSISSSSLSSLSSSSNSLEFSSSSSSVSSSSSSSESNSSSSSISSSFSSSSSSSGPGDNYYVCDDGAT